ncbi:MAG TPA: MbnP family copper-binding protein [Marinagarivorans sp.]
MYSTLASNSESAIKTALCIVAVSLALMLLSGCGDSSSTTQVSNAPNETTDAFNLEFKAMVGELALNCDDTYSGLAAEQNYAIGVSDLRFYVSNIQFYDTNGASLATTLDDNAFQLNHAAGSVSLIDFTGSDSGYCELAAEGTARTNTQITGQVADSAIAAISFDIGVPQATMKAVIAATDNVEDTPSPLAEMYWSWASGYRHFVMNFTAMDATHTEFTENSGVHLGSRDCGTTGKALSEQDHCGLLNTPMVFLDNFDPSINSIVVDVEAILANLQAADFAGGGSFGAQCHSGISQDACHAVFPAFGLDLLSGQASAQNNSVFKTQ